MLVLTWVLRSVVLEEEPLVAEEQAPAMVRQKYRLELLVGATVLVAKIFARSDMGFAVAMAEEWSRC